MFVKENPDRKKKKKKLGNLTSNFRQFVQICCGEVERIMAIVERFALRTNAIS